MQNPSLIRLYNTTDSLPDYEKGQAIRKMIASAWNNATDTLNGEETTPEGETYDQIAEQSLMANLMSLSREDWRGEWFLSQGFKGW